MALEWQAVRGKIVLSGRGGDREGLPRVEPPDEASGGLLREHASTATAAMEAGIVLLAEGVLATKAETGPLGQQDQVCLFRPGAKESPLDYRPDFQKRPFVDHHGRSPVRACGVPLELGSEYTRLPRGQGKVSRHNTFNTTVSNPGPGTRPKGAIFGGFPLDRRGHLGCLHRPCAGESVSSAISSTFTGASNADH